MGTWGIVDSYDNKGPVGGATNPLTGAALARDRENQRAILELDGTQAYESVTILDGSISPKRAEIIVDTEGGASADTLETILTNTDGSTTLHDGMKLTLRSADPSRSVTVKHSNSEFGIQMVDGQDVVLGTKWGLKLKLVANKWFEDQGRAEILASEAMDTAEEALGRTDPATTTSRGICRVATLADMGPGAVVENGPAFLAAGSEVITTTPTPNAVPQADGDGEVWGLANNDLSNLTPAGTTAIAHYAMPDPSRTISISMPASSGGTVTSPADGILCFIATSTAVNGSSSLRTGDYARGIFAPLVDWILACDLSVAKDAVVTVNWNDASGGQLFLVRAKGSQ